MFLFCSLKRRIKAVSDSRMHVSLLIIEHMLCIKQRGLADGVDDHIRARRAVPTELGGGSDDAVGKIRLATHAEAVAVAVECRPLFVISRLHFGVDAVRAHHFECIFRDNAVAEVAYTAAGKNLKSIVSSFWLLTSTLGNLLVVFLSSLVDDPASVNAFVLYGVMSLCVGMVFLFITSRPNFKAEEE